MVRADHELRVRQELADRDFSRWLSDTVKMHWENKGEGLFTDFSEFSADGRTMAQ